MRFPSSFSSLRTPGSGAVDMLDGRVAGSTNLARHGFVRELERALGKP